MKKTLLFLVGILLISTGIYAQNNKSTIRFRLSDGTPLSIAINNRYYKKTGVSITVGGIPGWRPYIKVYRFRPYADGQGGKAELIYSGKIKIQPGLNYDALIEVRKHQLFLKEINQISDIPTQPPFNPKRDQPIENHSIQDKTNSDKATLSPQLQTIKKAMDQQVSDMEKLKTVKKYLGNVISAEDANQIASWFFFDDTKLKFAIIVYPKVTDKENFNELRSVLMEKSTKEQFDNFLEKQ